MYCPRCNRHFKRRTTFVERCNCGYFFVFTQNSHIEDKLMFFLERKADKNGSRYFSIDTIYSVYRENSRKKLRWFRLLITRSKPNVDKKAFASMYHVWREKSSLRSDYFIHTTSLDKNTHKIDEEFFAYGVERIIVVDDRIKVDVLVKNWEHISKKALIVSGDGYPGYLKIRAKKILEQQPNIRIDFLLDNSLTNIKEQMEKFQICYQVNLTENQIWNILTKGRYSKRSRSLKNDSNIISDTTSKAGAKNKPIDDNIAHNFFQRKETSILSSIFPVSTLGALGVFVANSYADSGSEKETSFFDSLFFWLFVILMIFASLFGSSESGNDNREDDGE
uniref:Uncharacterized protein n=1 Tax=Candidatus Kentrum sp. SD TaxID=2126332 RepID=A0A450Y8Z6_9GAMM|nr:MAG: hypothetical protein BECKSD772F_GA0070984_101934 [Candidatus Kentron sp. SD]VFK42616.1 MAG: hypothetical protein BECKSD772E_GA0070983_101835 [Candidatus Kentron sp. SD]